MTDDEFYQANRDKRPDELTPEDQQRAWDVARARAGLTNTLADE